tara:strand:+ start:6580 stop:8607 length:2028 start_codon:yes stop_codon:yes gene_type:complete
MVASRLESSIEYPEIKKLSENDKGYDATLYQVELYPTLECIIAVGNVNMKHKEKGVVFMSVYLVVDDGLGDQIGIYECLDANYKNLLDDDNDFDLDKLDDPVPLLFSFVSPAYLRRVLKLKRPMELFDEDAVSDEDEDEDEDEEVSDPEMKSSRLDLDDLVQIDTMDVVEGIEKKMMEESMEERRNYKQKGNHNWLQKFMRNKKYSLLDNEGSGDCFFAVLRDAFKGLNKDITVNQIRNELSENATQEVYENFKEQYDMYNSALQQSNSELIQLRESISKIREEQKSIKDRSKKREFVEQGKKLIRDFRRVKNEKEMSKKIGQEYAFMTGIESLNDFKAKIRTCDFWAEMWSINVLEKILNIKTIILSSENYDASDIDNILLCMDLKDDNEELFKPKYYIIMDYTGDHYKLVLYGGKRIFTFETMPHDVKYMIVEKCMESKNSKYNIIPKFKKLKRIILDKKNQTEGQEKKEIEKEQEEMEAKNNGELNYDENTVFQFYSKSADKPPGKGAGEKIPEADKYKYKELQQIPNWRKILSNFAVTPFELDGHRWKGVEWFYHASKFKKDNPEFYLQFSLDSGSEISEDAVMAKGAGGKTGKSRGKQLRPKSVVMDSDFFTSKRNEVEMERGQMAKYSQNSLAKRVLLATQNAKLVHYVRAAPPIVFYDTMRVREKLKK